MEEESVFFQSGGLRLEGLIDNSAGEAAVVVTHPHPLYGGNMHNNVVASIVEAYRREGYSTLRFNFRGVGQSGGGYGEGIGEQQDLGAALKYFLELGKSSIDLAGYSFGAWVNAIALKKLAGVRRVIMVSPPVNFMDFSPIAYSAEIRLVIAGSKDDIAPPEMIEKMLPTWNPEAELRIIQGADHFYGGKSGEITEVIRKFFKAGNTPSLIPKAFAGPKRHE
jgi:alpha/beta superfamily hydrolase